MTLGESDVQQCLAIAGANLAMVMGGFVKMISLKLSHVVAFLLIMKFCGCGLLSTGCAEGMEDVIASKSHHNFNIGKDPIFKKSRTAPAKVTFFSFSVLKGSTHHTATVLFFPDL